MPISQLYIHQFRNIAAATLTPSPAFNFVVGGNGSGKTSFLESIYLLGHGRAFRHLHANRIIQHNQSQLAVHAKIQLGDTFTTIGVAKNRNGDSQFKINQDDKVKTADLAQVLPLQLITPEGFDLLTGGPKYRRAFLDWGCFHQFPDFFWIWNQLRRLVKQRNALLRHTQSYAELRHWDQALIETAMQLSQFRRTYLTHIVPELVKTVQLFLPEYEFDCQYYPGWDDSKSYAALLCSHYERDKLMAYTVFGPHKADLQLKCGHIAASDLLSRGQLKLLVCALRLAQGEFYTKQTGRSCLYLIDDFASELDENKRILLAKRLKATRAQVFITAINKAQITHMIDENDKIFYVESGILLD